MIVNYKVVANAGIIIIPSQNCEREESVHNWVAKTKQKEDKEKEDPNPNTKINSDSHKIDNGKTKTRIIVKF